MLAFGSSGSSSISAVHTIDIKTHAVSLAENPSVDAMRIKQGRVPFHRAMNDTGWVTVLKWDLH